MRYYPRKDYASDDADNVDDELSAVNVSSFSVFDIRDFRLQSVTACELSGYSTWDSYGSL